MLRNEFWAGRVASRPRGFASGVAGWRTQPLGSKGEVWFGLATSPPAIVSWEEGMRGEGPNAPPSLDIY